MSTAYAVVNAQTHKPLIVANSFKQACKRATQLRDASIDSSYEVVEIDGNAPHTVETYLTPVSYQEADVVFRSSANNPFPLAGFFRGNLTKADLEARGVAVLFA